MVYLDYNATCPLPIEYYENVLKEILERGLANPSSLHKDGRRARALINKATESFARFIDADSDFIFWTSGATESNAWAIHSAINNFEFKNPLKTPRLLISSIEHESVLLSAKWWEKKGVKVDFIPVNQSGVISLDFVCEYLKNYAHELALIAVMAANNETGVIQPVEEVCKVAKEFSVPTLVDCVQILGKAKFNLAKIKPTYSTFSAHKLGGFKGVGAMVVEGEGRLLWPMIHGKQQKSLRGGTENPVGVGLFGRILDDLNEGRIKISENIKLMRDEFEEKLEKEIEDLVIFGKHSPRLDNTSYVGFYGVEGDGVLVNLDLEGVAASSGAACSSGSVDPSHVLLAMGYDKKISRSAVRFSAGFTTKWEDYEKVLMILPKIVERCRREDLNLEA